MVLNHSTHAHQQNSILYAGFNNPCYGVIRLRSYAVIFVTRRTRDCDVSAKPVKLTKNNYRIVIGKTK